MDDKIIKEEKKIVDVSQLSFEFCNKPILSSVPLKTQDSKVISLSNHKNLDKIETDYSNLVLKFTKSF